MQKLLAFALACTSLTFQTANALVDMRNANYSESWSDLEIPGSGYDLRVLRTYNSRSLFNGKFGFGWCSNFETKLEFPPEGNLRVVECGDGKDISYVQRKFDDSSIDVAADKIVKLEKEKNRSAPSSYFSDLKKKLKLSQDLRMTLAKKHNLTGTTDDSAEFYLNGSGVEKIVRKQDFYLRILGDGSSEKFDLKGVLAQISDKNGNFLKFNHKGNLLTDVVDNNGRKLTFSYHPNTNRIKEISGPGGVRATYEFTENNLSKAKNGSNENFEYKYDDLHNLVEIKYADKSTKVLKYDANKDWVVSFKDQDNCLETYDYTLSKEDPKNHYWSNVTKKCGDQVTNKSKYEFWFKERANSRGKYLEKVATDINGDKTEIVYHPTFSKPIVLKRNGSTTLFTYYETGLVKTRQIGKEITGFKYDQKIHKVAEVSVGKRKTSFKYDQRGNLVSANNSEGQSVKLTYDENGRIATIVDQAKRRVTVRYEERFGKPSSVEREGVGTINVTYKPTGEINKIDSKEGPAVAVQVASAFNNLLEVVSPAGIDLGL